MKNTHAQYLPLSHASFPYQLFRQLFLQMVCPCDLANQRVACDFCYELKGMTKFEFGFHFQGIPVSAECEVFPIDGSTELHVSPLDVAIFETFGKRILHLNSDGSITATVPDPAEERDYIFALAEGLANHFNN